MTDQAGADAAAPEFRFRPPAGPVAYLLYGHNAVERSILREWVAEHDQRPVEHGPKLVAVPPRAGSIADTAALRSVLDERDDLTLVPLRVGWLPARNPQHSAPRLRDLLVGDPRKPRTQIARMLQRRQPDNYTCVVGAPATLGQLRERYHAPNDSEAFTAFVLRQVELALDVEERRLQGRRYKVPRFVTEGVEADADYRHAMDSLAAQAGQPVEEVLEQSRRYLDEMVAHPSPFFLDWMGTITRRLTRLGYSRVIVDPASLERARNAVQGHPSAFLWTHKSHMDGIAVLSVMYDNDFPAPHSMGGLNMAFGPIGYLGRRGGVIFIRRTFADNPVYKATLQHYLGFLMSKRFPFSWAFEGTRSRTGKLGPPRYGLLKYIVDAAHATNVEDLHLIPVNISYDLIGETQEYAREDAGQPKDAENLSWFMGYLERLRAPMGNIYLDFAEPIVLPGRTPKPDAELLSSVAFEVARRVNDQVPVTLTALLCFALLSASPDALTRPELDRLLLSHLSWLRERAIRLADGLAREDLDQLEIQAENAFAMGVVRREFTGDRLILVVEPGKEPEAGFYRNTIVHYFVNKAIIELALARVVDVDPTDRVTAFFEVADSVRDLTKFEFFHSRRAEFPDELDAELARHDPDWRTRLTEPDGPSGLLELLQPLVAHTVLLPFVDSMSLVATAVASRGADDAPEKAELVAAGLKQGDRAMRMGRITFRSSAGKALLGAAVSVLEHRRLLTGGSPDLDGKRQGLVHEVDALAESLRSIGESARKWIHASR